MTHELTSDELRSIIKNADLIKDHHTCKSCKGTGYEIQEEETDPEAQDVPCEECNGVGYTDLLIFI